MACTHAYSSPLQVGSQKLARCFVRAGWRVAYISSPLTPLHLFSLGNPLTRHKFHSWLSKNHKDEIEEIIPLALAAPDGRFPLNTSWILRHWHKTLFRNLGRNLAEIGFDQPDLFYIDNIFLAHLLEDIQPKKTIFRIMDRHTSFPGWKNNLQPLLEFIAQKSDITAYSAQGLKQYAQNLAPEKSFFLPNGVEYEHFAGHHQPHPVYERLKPPVALYVGALDHRLDWKLLDILSSNLPEWTFLLVGPGWEKKSFVQKQNLTFHFPIGYCDLPSLMAGAQAGIIPFNVKEQAHHLQGVRPLKLLEYLAAGLPVVSSHWSEVENIDAPIHLCKTIDDWIKSLQKIQTSTHESKPGQIYAATNDWQIIFQKMLHYIA